MEPKMKKTEVWRRQSAYADTVYGNKIVGCTGSTDEEVKEFIGLPSDDDERECYVAFYRNYTRSDEDTAYYEVVIPFTD